MDALDLILGGSVGGLIWVVLQLRAANADLRAQVSRFDHDQDGRIGGTRKAQRRDASGRFA